MREHDIIYTTTTDNDHIKLGIINGFIRTIYDKKSNEPNKDILDLIDSYNDIPHRSLNYKSPNETTDEDELEYIDKMEHQVYPYHSEPDVYLKLISTLGKFIYSNDLSLMVIQLE
ncbi:hypothetical protein M9Y10_014243 [Tritrichomonas musculus]|uniref:Uncharacterized protein n=1 Tax=Tritrichomonas musculus TaxID=1915356 RepID=A0ABR2L274_9EUKA